jgi:hypothetical protein
VAKKILNPEIISETRSIISEVSSPDDILNLTYKNVDVGWLIYNTYIANTGEGTISNINRTIWSLIHKSIIYVKYFRELFKNYCIEYTVLNHENYLKWGIMAQISLENDSEVIIRGHGIDNLHFRRVQTQEDLRVPVTRPSTELVEHIFNTNKNEAIKEIDEYLQKRFGGKLDGKDINNSFNSANSTKESRMAIEKVVSDENPNVLVMAHVFTDATHRGCWNIFPDYLTWFRETIRLALENKNVNWLIKPHPSAVDYSCNQTVESEVNKITRGKETSHINIIENTNTSQLFDYMDLVLTVRGTGGLEFTTQGIPTLIAGQSRYSGFGFTIEPKTKQDYKNSLSNLTEVEPLSQEQIEWAKVVAYIYFVLFDIKSDLLCPTSKVPSDLSEENKYYECLSNRIKNTDVDDVKYKEYVEKFISRNMTHLCNYDEFGNQEI